MRVPSTVTTRKATITSAYLLTRLTAITTVNANSKPETVKTAGATIETAATIRTAEAATTTATIEI